MKRVSIIVVSLLLTACGQHKPSAMSSDPDIEKRLSGTWTNEHWVGDDEHYSWVGVFKPDGTYAGERTFVLSNKTSRVSEAGRFVVKDRVLVVANTTRNGTNAPAPRVDRMRIVRVDGRELVLKDEERPDVTVTNRRER